MKRSIKYISIAFISVLLAGGLVACKENETSTTPPALSAPSDLSVSLQDSDTITRYVVKWAEVENAVRYSVGIDENFYYTKDAYFDMTKYMSIWDKYTISVIAIGDGENYSDSQCTAFEYTRQTVTSGLQYTLLEEGTYAVQQDRQILFQKRSYFPILITERTSRRSQIMRFRALAG